MKYPQRKCASADCPKPGKKFIPIRKDQVYCSQRCSNREAQRRYNERQKEAQAASA